MTAQERASIEAVEALENDCLNFLAGITSRVDKYEDADTLVQEFNQEMWDLLCEHQ